MSGLDGSVRIPKHVIFRDLDGEAVILNLETGAYLGLNPVGTRIWQLIEQGASLRQVWIRLQEEFDATAAQLESDLIGFVDELRSNGLVIAEQS